MPDPIITNPVQTVLAAVGLPAEDIAAIISVPEDKVSEFNVKPYADKVRSNYSTQLANDPAFFTDLTVEKLPKETVKKIESAQFGRASNIVRQKLLKGLGMTEADYQDLPEDQQKDIETFALAMAEKYTKSKANDPKLQQDLIEARKKLEAFGPDYEAKIKTEAEKSADVKISTAIFNANLVAALAAVPNLKIPAADLAKTAADALLNEYGFAKIGDFAIELRQKANPEMKVLKNGSSHELTLGEAVIELAVKRGWADKEDAPVDPKKGGGRVDIKPTNGGLKAVVPPHMQKTIEDKIAAEK